MSFFAHYRFWLPFVILLCVELFFQSGLYEPLVKRESFVGKTIQAKQAVSTIGSSRVNFVTLGDSKARLGLNHTELLRASQGHGLLHINLSINGAHLLAYKKMVEWIRKDFPNVKGVFIGVNAHAVIGEFDPVYELPVIQPFRRLGDFIEVERRIPFKANELDTYGTYSALFLYRKDIKDFIKNPLKRIEGLYSQQPPWGAVLAGENMTEFNLCFLDLSTPEACVRSSRNIISYYKNSSGLEEYEDMMKSCSEWVGRTPASDKSIYEQIKKYEGSITRSWKELFESLRFDVRPVVVLLPEHSFVRRYVVPGGTVPWVRSMLKGFEDEGLIDLIDMSDRFIDGECRYFADVEHLNRVGMQDVSRDIVPVLEEKFYRKGRGTASPG